MKRLVPLILACLVTSFFISSWQLSIDSPKKIPDAGYSMSEGSHACHQSITLTARCMTYMASIISFDSLTLFSGISLFITGLFRLSNWIKPYQTPPSSVFRPPIP